MKTIPTCPTFKTIEVCGHSFKLLPGLCRLDQFLRPILYGRFGDIWVGRHFEEMANQLFDKLWPEPARCQVKYWVEDEEGNRYSRWDLKPPSFSSSGIFDLEKAKEEYPEDQEEIEALFRYGSAEYVRDRERSGLLQRALQAGEVLQEEIKAEVLRQLKAQVPEDLYEQILQSAK